MSIALEAKVYDSIRRQVTDIHLLDIHSTKLPTSREAVLVLVENETSGNISTETPPTKTVKTACINAVNRAVGLGKPNAFAMYRPKASLDDILDQLANECGVIINEYPLSIPQDKASVFLSAMMYYTCIQVATGGTAIYKSIGKTRIGLVPPEIYFHKRPNTYDDVMNLVNTETSESISGESPPGWCAIS